MTPDETRDPIFEQLKRLPSLAPDRDRTDRLRIRCRARLDRSRQYQRRTTAVTGFGRRAVAVVAFVAFCILYVAELVTQLRGFL
jgi:hypothetical protein